MIVLGICDNIDSGAVLIKDKRILTAINEERLTREKLCVGFPEKSIRHIIKTTKINPSKIDKVCIASKITPGLIFRIIPNSYKILKKDYSEFNSLDDLNTLLSIFSRKTNLIKIQSNLAKSFMNNKLKKSGIGSQVHLIDHHTAHAYSGFFTSPFKKALIFTIDGIGDGLSGTVNIGEKNSIKKIHEINGLNSPGLFYSRITELLGYKPHRHEGKITGLAAHGDPEKTIGKISRLLYLKNNMIKAENNLFFRKKDKGIYKKLQRYDPEDVAAGAQTQLEKVICNFILYWIDITNIHNICLAGGVFANVKLNQKIHELSGVNNIYVYPHMGDGGLAMGACLSLLKRQIKLEDVYLGPEFSNKKILQEIKRQNMKYKYHKNIEKQIAILLSKGKVVAKKKKKMEYGPRALGNRSILYQTTDKSVNKWLNNKLKRTEFMPFAPVTLKEFADKCYKNLTGAEHTAKFMTITFECTEFMKKKSPGVVHIDGTARPQIISKKDNSSYYKILKEYHKITGIPSLINTSFNKHGEPIVCSPKDAIKSFKKSNLNCLAMGDYIIKI